MEIHYIALYNSCLGENGLNCQTGGKLGYSWNPVFLKEFSDFGKLCEFTEDHRNRLRIANTGKVRASDTHQKLMVHFYKNEKAMRNGALLKNQKKVIDLSNGKIYESVKSAGTELGIPLTTLSQYLTGARTNKTTLRYI